MPLYAGRQHLVHRSCSTSSPRRSRSRSNRRSPAPRQHARADLISMTPSPIMPRSLRMSLVGTSQSQTWKASRRSCPCPRDLGMQFGIPPDVIDVEGDAEHAGAVGIETVADVERLFGGVHAGTVGRVSRMQRLDGQRHLRLPRIFHHLGDAVIDLRARIDDVLRRRRARPRILRQAADDQHDAR